MATAIFNGLNNAENSDAIQQQSSATKSIAENISAASREVKKI